MTASGSGKIAGLRYLPTGAAGLALAGLLAANVAHSQVVPDPVCSGPSSECCPVDQFNCQTDFSYSTAGEIVLNSPSVTTLATTRYETELLARIDGGSLVYDRSFALPFADPAVQDGVAQARVAITTAGGPGVLILGPTLTRHNVTTTSSSVTTYSLNHSSETDTVATYIGSTIITDSEGRAGAAANFREGDTAYVNGVAVGTFGEAYGTRTLFETVVDGVVTGPTPDLYIGPVSNCDAAMATLPSTVKPVCVTGGGLPVLLSGGQVDININFATTYYIDQATVTTEDTLMDETYTLTGTVKPIGVVHAVAPVAAFDQGEGLAARGFAQMPGDGVHVWLAPWGSRGTTAGDRRDASGIDGGLTWGVARHVTLGIAVDTGHTDLSLSDGSEWGRLDLAGVGVFARFGGETGWGASLGAGSERGHVRATVTVPGFSDVGSSRELVTQGWAAAEVHDTIVRERWAVIPNAGIITSHARFKGFNETGSQFDLDATAQSLHRNRAWVGVDAVWSATTKLDLSMGIKAIRFSGAVTPTRKVTFADFPDAGVLTVTALAAKKTGANVDLGANYHVGKSSTVFVSFNATARDKHTDTAIFAGFRVGF